MFRKQIRLIIMIMSAASFSACSYVKSLFPDKEKDYQYTTEIPALTVPPELNDNPAFLKQANSAENVGLPSDSQQFAATASSSFGSDQSEYPQDTTGTGESVVGPSSSVDEEIVDESGQTQENSTAYSQELPPASGEPSKPQAQLVVYNDGETRLQIAAMQATAWRKVGKALSRQSVEVTERDQTNGSYTVQYDPNEQKFDDASLWDEVKFIFTGFETNDKQFELRLIANNNNTDVAILNRAGEPATSGAALSLLKLLQNTINADQSD